MSLSIRYGVTIEFTVASEGGPSKQEIRRYVREAIEGWRGQYLGREMERFASLRNVGVKYLHEASQHKKDNP